MQLRSAPILIRSGDSAVGLEAIIQVNAALDGRVVQVQHRASGKDITKLCRIPEVTPLALKKPIVAPWRFTMPVERTSSSKSTCETFIEAA